MRVYHNNLAAVNAARGSLPWMDSEVALLRDLWPENYLEDVAKAIPRHKRNALKQMASKLGLKKSAAHRQRILDGRSKCAKHLQRGPGYLFEGEAIPGAKARLRAWLDAFDPGDYIGDNLYPSSFAEYFHAK